MKNGKRLPEVTCFTNHPKFPKFAETLRSQVPLLTRLQIGGGSERAKTAENLQNRVIYHPIRMSDHPHIFASANPERALVSKRLQIWHEVKLVDVF